MSAFRQYANLLERLYLARNEQEVTTQEEYVFTCDLESLWAELTEAEQRQVEKLTEEYKRRLLLKAHPITPRVFGQRLDDLIFGLAFLSGIVLPGYDGWHCKPPDPWAALRRAGGIFR